MMGGCRFCKKKKKGRKEIMLKGEFALSQINEGVFLLLKHLKLLLFLFNYNWIW